MSASTKLSQAVASCIRRRCCKPRILRAFSTNPRTASSFFAVVDHAQAYEDAMDGRHGQQLALAALEGLGKDEKPFDPFHENQAATELQQFIEEPEDNNDSLEASNEAEETTPNEHGDESENNDNEEVESDDDEDEEKSEDGYGDYEELVRRRYNNDGSVRYQKSQLAAFRAGAPAGGMFAVVELSGSQHKVTVDDVLVVNRLKPVHQYAVGTTHTFRDNVLLVGSSHKTLVGMPVVDGAEVDVMVEEITKDAKVIVFKKRRRKHSQRKNGFRRDVTMLRITDIRMPSPHNDHYHLPRPDPTQSFP